MRVLLQATLVIFALATLEPCASILAQRAGDGLTKRGRDADGLRRFRKYGEGESPKVGYLNRVGIVIEPKFDNGEDFYDGLALVSVNNKYGYIDGAAKYVISPRFTYAGNFSEGLASVEIGNKSGYMNKAGKVVIPPRFDRAFSFKEGLAIINVGDKRGFINKRGKIVIEPTFAWAGNFSEGLAPVMLVPRGKWGFIDKRGIIVIRPQFDHEGGFSEGLSAVSVLDQYGFIDRTGRYVIKPQFHYAANFSEGLARVCYASVTNLTPTTQVVSNHRCGYIDKTGAFVISPNFLYDTTDFSEGLAAVKITANGWNYIDRTGKVVLHVDAHASYPFSHGVAVLVASSEGANQGRVHREIYIDKTGRVIWDSREDRIHNR